MRERKTRVAQGRITEKQFEALETLAQWSNLTVSAVIGKMIDRAIEEYEMTWLREEPADAGTRETDS